MRTRALLILAVLAAGGCPDEGETSSKQIMDHGVIQPEVYITSPKHMATRIPPNADVLLLVTAITPNPSAIYANVQKAMRLERYPSGTPIAGSWGKPGLDTLEFEPSSPLAPGDYAVRFVGLSPQYLFKTRPYSVFRVGDCFRLVEVRSTVDDKTKTVSAVSLRFTAKMDSHPTVSIETLSSSTKSASWTAVGASAKLSNGAPTLALATPVSASDKLRITLSAAKSTAGDSLDTTVPIGVGSKAGTPIVLEFVPEEHRKGDAYVYTPSVPGL